MGITRATITYADGTTTEVINYRYSYDNKSKVKHKVFGFSEPNNASNWIHTLYNMTLGDVDYSALDENGKY